MCDQGANAGTNRRSTSIRPSINNGGNTAQQRGRSQAPRGVVMVQRIQLPDGRVLQRQMDADEFFGGGGANGMLGAMFGGMQPQIMARQTGQPNRQSNTFGNANQGMMMNNQGNLVNANGQIMGRQVPRMDPITEMFAGLMGINNHPFLNPSNRGHYDGHHVIVLDGREVDEEFADHSRFMRANRNNVRNANFIEQLLGALMGMGVMGPARPQHPTLNKKELTDLKIITFKKKPNQKSGEEEKCPICFAEFENGDKCKSLPCDHIYHTGCIDTWLVRNATCPICKRDIKNMLQGGTGENNRP